MNSKNIRKGTYCLLINLEADLPIKIGKKGKMNFEMCIRDSLWYVKLSKSDNGPMKFAYCEKISTNITLIKN